MSPTNDLIKDAYPVSLGELQSGRLCPNLTEELFAKSKQQSEDKEKLLPVLVLPLVFGVAREHGVTRRGDKAFVAPIIVSAGLSRSGELIRDADAKLPVLSRDLLEPTARSVAIGTLDAADACYAANSTGLTSWSEALDYAQALFEKVTESNYRTYVIPGWEREAAGRILVADDPPEARHILQFYDWLRQKQEVPLLGRFLSKPSTAPLLGVHGLLAQAHRHTGHYTSRHPLAASQRNTLVHLLASYSECPQITVVNGPPGTGKTTLIQNIVASLWVNAALQELECPLVVAASTSNQAVTNVNEAFDRGEFSSSDPLSGRWLSKVTSFGIYMASSLALNHNGGRYQTYEEMPRSDRPARHFASYYETPEGFKAGVEEFLSKFAAAKLTTTEVASVGAARSALLAELKGGYLELRRLTDTISKLSEACGSGISLKAYKECWKELEVKARSHRAELAHLVTMQSNLRNLLTAWHEHRASEPWWMALLSFLHPIKRLQLSRDTAFFLRHSSDLSTCQLQPAVSAEAFENECSRLESSMRESEARVKQEIDGLESALEWFRERVTNFETWCASQKINGEEVEILRVLDTRLRHRMFQLATHYWEAGYLLEVEKLLAEKIKDSSSPVNLERHYRRLAMLAPCFISTLHMLPKWFRGYLRDEAYLTNTIDLLVIDEAGQVSPEVAAAALALAKRTCIVGDEHQIEPVSSVPEPIDRVNAARHLKASDADYDRLADSGLMAGSGSILQMGQKVSPYSTHPSIAPGFFLTEHRRCLPRIIEYCNDLVYQGLLEPCREHEEFAHRLAPFSWMHVPGRSEKRSGSRVNEAEAEIIASWVATRAGVLAGIYKRPLREVLAIITPFNGQAQEIQRALKKKGLVNEKLTVGTLHAMQGAERQIIIFSPTYGANHQSSLFFNRTSRMLNVAVSRAKDAFLVIGNMDLFRGLGSDPVSCLGKCLFSDISNELEPLPDVPPAYVTRTTDTTVLSTIEEHRVALQRVFTSARREAIVVSPFLTERALAADNVPELIRAATTRGVRVIVVADAALNKDKVALARCIKTLESAGAFVSVTRHRGIHCKVLCRDDDYMVSGSFNWLAAVREESRYRRFEISVLKEGVAAQPAIAAFVEAMRQLVPWPPDEPARAGNA